MLDTYNQPARPGSVTPRRQLSVRHIQPTSTSRLSITSAETDVKHRTKSSQDNHSPYLSQQRFSLAAVLLTSLLKSPYECLRVGVNAFTTKTEQQNWLMSYVTPHDMSHSASQTPGDCFRLLRVLIFYPAWGSIFCSNISH